MSNALPLVSVLIPVYKAEKYVAEAIDSCLNQTYKNIEIIIVDDGSTDNSWKIIESYEKKYPQIIKTFRQENKGSCAARNKALKESSGNYIQWLDADDILDRNKIQTQLQTVNFAFETDILLSAASAKFYTDLRKTKFIPNPLWNNLNSVDFLYRFLAEGFFIYPHCWLVSRHLTEKAGYWNGNLLLNQDGEYFSRVIASCSLVKFVNGAKCFYRTGNLSSISNKKSKQKAVSLIQANLEIVNNVNSLINNNKLKNASRVFLERFYAGFLYEDNEIPEINLVKEKIIELGGRIHPKKESFRFYILRKLLGLKIAREIKLFGWSIQRKINKLLNRIPEIKN